jgi:hypothetical protein
MLTKQKTTNILKQKGCRSSNVLSFNQLYILWVELWKKIQHMCVIKPQTISNNQNETL